MGASLLWVEEAFEDQWQAPLKTTTVADAARSMYDNVVFFLLFLRPCHISPLFRVLSQLNVNDFWFPRLRACTRFVL